MVRLLLGFSSSIEKSIEHPKEVSRQQDSSNASRRGKGGRKTTDTQKKPL
jgi:hypothetical protein